MEEHGNVDVLLGELKAVISNYLGTYVSNPAIETATKNIEGQASLANLLTLVDSVTTEAIEKGLDYDHNFLRSLSPDEIEKRIQSFSEFLDSDNDITSEMSDEVATYLDVDGSKKFLLYYFIREMHWIVISVLSASYVSSLVQMRAAFELVVGIATRETSGMNERIDSILYFGPEEKSQLKKLWRRLCAWGHPYGKWIADVCPVYAGHKPLYHAQLFDMCLRELQSLVDFFVSVAISKYDLDRAMLLTNLAKNHVDVTKLEFLNRKL